MNYPSFYDKVENIELKDELSNFLGAFDNGEYEIGYLDVVKSAGHSCPTVASAYLMTLEGLKVLYPNSRAVRGNIKVEFKEDMQEGVAGVIGNVISQITGATDKSGFRGLNGKFIRYSLMHFNSNIESSVRFTRIDTNHTIDIYYNHSSILNNTEIKSLMQKILKDEANSEEFKKFGILWQEQVKSILESISEVITIKTI